MLGILKVDHIGIRIADKNISVAFYQNLGFKLLADAGYDQGHPIIMQHPSGVVVNLLGPGTAGGGSNILMDVDEKYPGYTHVALRVNSLEQAEAFAADHNIAITGRMQFKDMHAIFIRDPDGTVIELDAYPEKEPETRAESAEADDFKGFDDHG